MISLIDCSRYASFVGDWSTDHRLAKHLIEQFNQQSILSWGTGFETDWLVELRPGITNTAGHRELFGHVRCSNGSLHLANYDSLTMAAQFDDHLLPDKETAGYKVDLPPGLYKVRVVQTIDPKGPWWEVLGDNPAFLVEYESTSETPPPAAHVPWAEYL
jgi:hypothetical protein